jgi:hypothetical protein
MLALILAGSAARFHWMVRPDEPSPGRIDESSKEVVMGLASRMLLVLPLVATVATAQPTPARRAVAQPGQPPARLAARWIGQDGQDWTGPGPSVGPNGLQDVHIHLSRLSPGVAVKAIRIEGPAGARWEQGTNPKLLSNAELVRDARDASEGELYFQPDRDLSAQRLKVMVAYENDRLDTATLVAGRCDPALALPASPMPELREGALEAAWLGQDGANASSPGDVHVSVSGLPASLTIVGAVLTDAVRGTWIYKSIDRVAIPADPDALPLVVKLRSDRKSADLFFPPYRDLGKETLTLRLIAANGGDWLVRFPGGSCDLGRRARQPEPSRALASRATTSRRWSRNSGPSFSRPGLTGWTGPWCLTGLSP